jgi:arylsulfatase A-like enzyme
MHAAGYHTGYFGKYMNGLGEEPKYVAPGWDRWVVLADGKMNVDGEIRDAFSSREVDLFSARQLRRFIRRHQDSGPWFAVYAPTSPHNPYTPSRRHRHDFDEVRWDPPAFNEADMSDKPSWLRDLPMLDRRRMRRELEGKLEELQDLDDQIGKTLDVLTKSGQLGSTWIFFISDNGYLLGEHRLFRKQQPYEESAGVPFVVRGPGVSPAVRDTLVSQVDLMPTTLDIAGLDPDNRRELDGRSMVGPLTSGNWTRWRKRLLVENTNLGWAMLRDGSIAYIEHETNHEREFYNLERDPHQLTSRRNADVRRFAERLDRLRQSGGTTLRAFEE